MCAIRAQPSAIRRMSGGARGAVAAEALDALGEVDGVAAEAALDQHGGEVGGVPRRLGPSARRRQAPCGRGAAAAGAPAARRPLSVMRPSRIEGAELVEERPRLGQGRGGRRIEEGELSRIGDAPGGAVEDERRKIGRQDLGPAEGLERAGRGLLPEPVADAGLGAAGAAAALVGGGARDAHRLEPRQADVGLVDRHAGEA